MRTKNPAQKFQSKLEKIYGQGTIDTVNEYQDCFEVSFKNDETVYKLPKPKHQVK